MSFPPSFNPNAYEIEALERVLRRLRRQTCANGRKMTLADMLGELRREACRQEAYGGSLLGDALDAAYSYILETIIANERAGGRR